MSRLFRYCVYGFLVAWLLVSLATCVIFVDQTEFVYVTQFGRPVATYDGQTDAGAHFKLPWPFQTTLRLDNRLHVLDLPTQEFLIRDREDKTIPQVLTLLGQPLNAPMLGSLVLPYFQVVEVRESAVPLTFDLTVYWRIADALPGGGDPVDQFVRTFGSTDKAQAYLRSEVTSRLKLELSRLFLDELYNTDANRIQVDSLLERLQRSGTIRGEGETQESLVEKARKLGIDIVDVGLRRFNHPASVRDAVYAKLREARAREAKRHRDQAEELRAAILADAATEADRIRQDALSYASRLRSDGFRESAAILDEAHQEAPELFQYARLLKSYEQMFADDKTQFLLSLDHPLLSLFKGMPKLGAKGGIAPPPPPLPEEERR